MIHLRDGNGEGDDLWDGRDQQLAVQLCGSGGAHPGVAPDAEDQAGGK